MQGVTVVDHPLVQHKLTIMRDKNTKTRSFRNLLREIATLLCYEVTRDLPLHDLQIETPVAPMIGKEIDGKKLVLAPILRSGWASSKACSISYHRRGWRISGSTAIRKR